MQESEIREAADYVRGNVTLRPSLGVVLGSGLGGFVDRLADPECVPYARIPHLPQASVAGHAGNLYLGRVGTSEVACLQGRVHAYEGHALGRVVFGVRLLAELGCGAVLLTNAAGGIAAGLGQGDLMLITDHINLMGNNPLLGSSGSAPRFVDMSVAYDENLRMLAKRAAQAEAMALKEGIYAGLLGPSYETPAEIRMLRTLGADAVGMSTVPEVIALRQLGVRVGAVSLITNLAAGLSERPLDHTEVQQTAERARAAFGDFLERWLELAGNAP